MKKLLLFTAVALLGLTTTNAQVKFGFGFGYAMPSGDIADITDGGFSGNLELGYGITEDIDVSVFLHGDFLTGGNEGQLSYDTVVLGSYMLNGRYYFTKEGFRPYGSLAIGLTDIGQIEAEANNTRLAATSRTSNFSFRPAIGFKYGIFNMNVAYLSAGKVGESGAKQSVGDITINAGLLFTFGGN